MIAPQELRLGNLIDKYGKPIKVDLGIWTKINNGSVIYKPIELTEEWLLKFGFEKKWDNIPGVGTFYFYQHILLNHRITEQFTMPIAGVKIKSVHQLQNLTFALTGEDLTIKEQK